MFTISLSLPSIYKNILPQQILNISLQEKKINCHQCNKTGVYRADLKCCTYEPFLPNYLVGAILLSDLPGKVGIQDKIQNRRYSLPLGLVAPVSFQVEFNLRKLSDFGNREDWLCPYYDKQQNNCGIWRYRGAVCSSFFCESSYQEKGEKFWRLMGEYLNGAEMALAQENLVHLDFSPRRIDQMLSYLNRKEAVAGEEKATGLSLELEKEIWQDRVRHQEDFFIQCHDFVQKLSRDDLSVLMGATGERLKDQLLHIAQDIKSE